MVAAEATTIDRIFSCLVDENNHSEPMCLLPFAGKFIRFRLDEMACQQTHTHIQKNRFCIHMYTAKFHYHHHQNGCAVRETVCRHKWTRRARCPAFGAP